MVSNDWDSITGRTFVSKSVIVSWTLYCVKHSNNWNSKSNSVVDVHFAINFKIRTLKNVWVSIELFEYSVRTNGMILSFKNDNNVDDAGWSSIELSSDSKNVKNELSVVTEFNLYNSINEFFVCSASTFESIFE